MVRRRLSALFSRFSKYCCRSVGLHCKAKPFRGKFVEFLAENFKNQKFSCFRAFLLQIYIQSAAVCVFLLLYKYINKHANDKT